MRMGGVQGWPARTWDWLRGRTALEVWLSVVLVIFGLLMFVAGPLPGIFGVLGSALLASEVVLRRAMAPVGLGGVALLGASAALAPTEPGAVLALFFAAALALPLSRDRKPAFVAAMALGLAYVGADSALALTTGADTSWHTLAINLVALNLTAAVGYEMAASRRAAMEQDRQAEAVMRQLLAYARDLQQSLRESRALRHSILAVRAEQDPGGVVRQLAKEVLGLTRADAVEVLSPAGPGQWASMAVAPSDRASALVGPLAATGLGALIDQVAESARPLWLVGEADGLPVQLGPGGAPPILSLALLPILVDRSAQQVLAVVWQREEHAFTPGERKLLEALAEQAGVALELAMLSAELAARAEGAEALHRVAAQMAGRRDVRETAEDALAALRALYDADAGSFYVVEDHGAIRGLVASGLPPSLVEMLHSNTPSGAWGALLRADRSQVVDDVAADPRLEGVREALIGEGIASLVVVPAISKGRAIGGLVLYHRRTRTYRPHQIELLETFAQQLAGALDLAQAYSALATLDRQREEFLALVSHELRQPVAAIVAVAEALADTPGLGAPERHALAGLCQQASTLARFAEDILAVARMETGLFQLRPVLMDLGALVVDLAHRRPQRARLRVDVPPDPVMLEADPERLGQAIDNLVSNALRYSPSDSPVYISVGCTDQEARVQVRDEGVGLAPDDIPRLFQKYGRVRNPRTAREKGVGLGLYLVRLLVEAHGGRAAAASPGPGQGSTFTITLPRQQRADGAAPVSQGARETTARG